MVTLTDTILMLDIISLSIFNNRDNIKKVSNGSLLTKEKKMLSKETRTVVVLMQGAYFVVFESYYIYLLSVLHY